MKLIIINERVIIRGGLCEHLPDYLLIRELSSQLLMLSVFFKYLGIFLCFITPFYDQAYFNILGFNSSPLGYKKKIIDYY